MKYLVGSNLSEKLRNSTIINKIRFWFNCVAGSFVNGTDESILILFSLSASPGYKSFKKRTSILFEKVNNDEISDRSFHPENNNGHFLFSGVKI